MKDNLTGVRPSGVGRSGERLLGAGPFYFEGGKPAALLIHGFTGSADEMVYLGQRIAEAGITASLPLLPGHGTAPEDLRDVSRWDWLECVHREFVRLTDEHDPVYIVGLSMGGLLALELAGSAEGKCAAGLALLATPLKLNVKFWPTILPPIADWQLLNRITWSKGEEGVSIADTEEQARAVSYLEAPGRSLAQLFKLMKESDPALVQMPTFLVYSKSDPSVPFSNMKLIHDRLGSRRIETLKLQKSYHVVSRDLEKDLVAEQVIRFFKSC
jgi:carboxylesterase